DSGDLDVVRDQLAVDPLGELRIASIDLELRHDRSLALARVVGHIRLGVVGRPTFVAERSSRSDDFSGDPLHRTASAISAQEPSARVDRGKPGPMWRILRERQGTSTGNAGTPGCVHLADSGGAR